MRAWMRSFLSLNASDAALFTPTSFSSSNVLIEWLELIPFSSSTFPPRKRIGRIIG